MSTNFSVLTIGLFFLFALGSIGLYFWLKRHFDRTPSSLDAEDDSASMPALWLKFEPNIPCHEGTWEQQDPLWQKQMLKAGKIFSQAKIQKIYFLHGTFVGSDPFNILSALQTLLPESKQNWAKIFGTGIKKTMDWFARDLGNFLPGYVNLFSRALGDHIPCQALIWSSANHHLGRLQGAMDLIEELSHAAQPYKSAPILMIGHSHARQVFALFSHLIHCTELGQQLWTFMLHEKLVHPDLKQAAERLRELSFDFVTLGGPLRYSFAPSRHHRFLHIINHRGESHEAEEPFGFWKTAGGDYIQQWGGVGSDTLAARSSERLINRKLDTWLGVGVDAKIWRQTVANRQRMKNLGQTLLVDYGDHGGRKPNGINTIFGHGIYTRYRTMLFLTSQICRFLYDTHLEN